MRQREAEFCQFEKIKIAVGTWNVNGKCPAASVREWLGRADGTSPDVVVVCLQEMVDLVAGNLVVETKSRSARDEWCEKLLRDLNAAATSEGGTSSASADASPPSTATATAAPPPLPPKHQRYELLHSKFLVGIMIAVFVRTEHRSQISEVHGATVGTGIMNMMGNKGGAAVRFRMRDSTLCFVCAHLAAHRDNVDARNADVKHIVEKMAFHDEARGGAEGAAESAADGGAPPSERAGGAGAEATRPPPPPPPPRASADGGAGPAIIGGAAEALPEDEVRRGDLGQRVLGDVGRAGWDSATARHSHGLAYGILDHDLVIWAGDLNYRIDSELTIDEVHMLVSVSQKQLKRHAETAKKSLQRLQELDQLWIARQAESVLLSMFDEAPLDFLPTYKFIAGTSEYDRRPEKKKRAPAWCDRVLWRAARPDQVTCTQYTSVTALIGSDHMPVVAHIEGSSARPLCDVQSLRR